METLTLANLRFEKLLKIPRWCVHVGVHFGVILESQADLAR